MLDLKITGGLVVLRHEVRRLDIGVADGRIVRLAEHITGEASSTLTPGDFMCCRGWLTRTFI